MKWLRNLLLATLTLSALVVLALLVQRNSQLAQAVSQLELELGQMPIGDGDLIHVVAIEDPWVPPEVASHVDRLWQFRCYLPPGFDFKRMSGGGRVTQEGLYFQGGFSTNWSSPQADPYHKLLTVSLKRSQERVEVFYSFGGSSGTSSWDSLSPASLEGDDLLVQKLVQANQPARSFDQSTILPLLKVLDRSSVAEKQIAGEMRTTYAGGMIVICPTELDAEFAQLRRGENPSERTHGAFIASPLP